MISLRNENDLLIGMTYDILIGMIDMTFICSVSIFCMEIETEPRWRTKSPCSHGIPEPLKKKMGITAGKTDKTASR